MSQYDEIKAEASRRQGDAPMRNFSSRRPAYDNSELVSGMLAEHGVSIYDPRAFAGILARKMAESVEAVDSRKREHESLLALHRELAADLARQLDFLDAATAHTRTEDITRALLLRDALQFRLGKIPADKLQEPEEQDTYAGESWRLFIIEKYESLAERLQLEFSRLKQTIDEQPHPSASQKSLWVDQVMALDEALDHVKGCLSIARTSGRQTRFYGYPEPEPHPAASWAEVTKR